MVFNRFGGSTHLFASAGRFCERVEVPPKNENQTRTTAMCRNEYQTKVKQTLWDSVWLSITDDSVLLTAAKRVSENQRQRRSTANRRLKRQLGLDQVFENCKRTVCERERAGPACPPQAPPSRLSFFVLFSFFLSLFLSFVFSSCFLRPQMFPSSSFIFFFFVLF